jgi:hypothetical protein
MKHIKSVNEFFDFFKKDDEYDKIALVFINRLKKVKDFNPYKIEKEILDNNSGNLITYKVDFDDTPIEIKRIKWKQIEYQGKILEDGYVLYTICIGDREKVICKEKYLEQLFDLVDKIYKNDIRRKRIEKINTEINPAADLLEEGLLDFFKKDTEDDKIALQFIKRLEKVKDKNPYNIKEIETLDDFPMWLTRWCNKNVNTGSEYYRMIYVVKFEDVDIIITGEDKNENGHIVKCNNPFKLLLGNDVGELGEKIKARESYRKRIFDLVDKIYKDDKERERLDRINTEINPAADLLESSNIETDIIFKNKRNPSLIIKVTKTRDGRITNIENETGIRFPFSVGQLLQRNVETWACNNNFLMDGKDTCPEKKIFGVRTKDVPQGHEWRHIYPNKF